MRSSHWEYLGFVLVGVGSAFIVSGSVTLFYFQSHPTINLQYSSYPIPLLFAGVCTIVLSVLPFVRLRARRREEIKESENLPPPPPPEALPPPPPQPPPPPNAFDATISSTKV